MTKQPAQVAIITSIIAPYRIPVFNALAAFDDVDLTVYFLSATRAGRDWRVYTDEIRFRYHVLREYRTSFSLLDIKASLELLLLLQKGEHEVVVWGGYTYPTSWIGLLLARSFGKTSILWSESNIFDKPRRKTIELLKSQIVKHFDRWLACGSTARDYLVSLGARGSEVYIAPNAVDTPFLATHSRLAREKAHVLKRQSGYPSRVILFVGQLVPRKGVADLLKAFRKIETPEVGLVIVGDGPERSQYERFCEEHDLQNVFFEGFQHRETLPRYYGLADLFVMPSLSEPWGLVLNEALSCSLPVIGSTVAGATQDLILPGANGYTCAPGAPAELAQLIDACFPDDARRREMGQISWKIIQHYTPEQCALGFAEVIQKRPNTAGAWAAMNVYEREQFIAKE